MAQWSKTDNAANSVNWAADSLNIGSGKAAQAANNTALFGNTTASAFIAGKAVGQFGVSVDEATASTAAHAGWVLRTEGTGNRAGRVHMEVLVAGGMITGDADSEVVPSYALRFTTQPTATTVATGSPATFTSAAASKPDGATITYQWQANTGAGYANIADGAVYSGVTTNELTVADTTGLTGSSFRVVIDATGAAPVNSKGAVLTVSP